MNQQTVQSSRSEKNEDFFQRKQLFNTKPLLKTLCATMVVLCMGTGLLSAPVAVYQADFDNNNWRKTEPAELVPFGRSGSCLKISTYRQNGASAKWESPMLKVQPGAYTVSGWTADNLAFTQDPGYGGLVAAVLYDKDGRELKRIELAKVWKRPHRDKYDFYAFPGKGGLSWRYFETGITVPANAAAMRVVFTWANFTVSWRHVKKNVIGEVYLDDLMIATGKPKKSQTAIASVKITRYPYKLRINTPVYSNVFVKGDPLEFTVRLDGKNAPPAVKPGMMLEYRIEDFQKLLIDSGSVPLRQPYTYWKKNAKSKQKSLLKTFYLDKKIAGQIGRWMAVKCTLKYRGKVLAEGENAFCIIEPRKLTEAEKGESHFWGSDGVASHGWDLTWKRRQPTKASPIDFSKDYPSKDYPMHRASRYTFEFQERNPLRTHWLHYTQARKVVPKWALLSGKKTTDDDFIDPRAYAVYIKEYVKHTNVLYYYVTSPEGGSIERFSEMVKAAYTAVKEVDPRLQVVAQVDYFKGKKFAEKLCKNNLIPKLCNPFFKSKIHHQKA